jgi:hypothetical protein
MAWFRFPHSVAVSDRSSRSLPWAGVSQLPTRTSRRRTPFTRRMSAAAKKGTSLAVETEPGVGLRSGLR